MRRGAWIWTLLLPLACTSGTDEGSAFGDNGGPVATSPASPSTGGASTGTTTGAASSQEGLSTGASGSDTTASDPTEDPSGVTTSACMQAPTGMAALGETCMDGCECSSAICFGHPLLGMTCSACLSDVECQTAGVGTCSIDPETDAGRCTGGELGVMCDPAATGCAAGLSCEQLIDTAGVLPDTFCSGCATSADCALGEACTPDVVIDGVQPGGFLHCIPQGSGADGTFCPASGDASACASGICAVVDVGGLGIAELGVCGPCAADTDCPGGTCEPPTIDENGAVPSRCI